MRIHDAINEHFQIASVDPVLRVGVGLWGLNDRDISIKRPNQPRLLDGLVAILKDRGIGMHLSELERSNLMSVSGLSAQGLFSLAVGDSRLNVNSGQYLYLAEWGGPRRESMSEAVAAVLTPSAPPLALDEILLQVEKRMRRLCDRRSLINCLHALEVEMDPLNRKMVVEFAIASRRGRVGIVGLRRTWPSFMQHDSLSSTCPGDVHLQQENFALPHRFTHFGNLLF